MYIQLKFVILLIMTYQQYASCSLDEENFGLCKLFKVFSLDQIGLCHTARKVNFFQKKIEIPVGVTDAVASEIQNILNHHENRVLNLTQDLISCDGSSSQYEKYLRSYKQFQAIKSSLRDAPKYLKQRFINKSDFNSKHSKLFFDVFQIFNQALDILNNISLLFNFQVNVMKPAQPPSTVAPVDNSNGKDSTSSPAITTASTPDASSVSSSAAAKPTTEAAEPTTEAANSTTTTTTTTESDGFRSK